MFGQERYHAFFTRRITRSLRVLAAASILQASYSVGSTDIHIVSEEFPPLQSQGAQGKTGYVHQLLQEALRRASKTYPIRIASYEFLPWKRALLKAEMSPNTLLYSLSRTVEREPKYQWLAEVSVYRQSLFKLESNRALNIDSLSQLKHSGAALSVQNGSATQQYLESLGYSKDSDFRTFIHYQQGIKQLYKGRIDLIPLNQLTARIAACKLGLDGNLLTPAIPVESLSKPLWAVFSKQTPPALVAAVRQAISDIKHEGLFDQYYAQAMLSWENTPCQLAAK
ncbi:MAG: substrate-binding periplasmic protein [Pseudomonadales bacterium]